MEKFLNNSDSLSEINPRSSTASSSFTLPPPSSSTRSLPRNRRSSPRPASVDLGYFTKTSSIADSDSDIPANIIAQFEQEMLHSNFKRDSFRAKNASTRHFVLNPIFDETANMAVSPENPVKSNRTLPRSTNRSTSTDVLSLPTSPAAVVETVFTDLGTLRRSTSLRNRKDSFPHRNEY